MSSVPIVIVDCETDGLHPGRRMWEYAIIRLVPCISPVDGGFVTYDRTVHHAFVGIDLRYSDPYGLKVGGFFDRHPAGRKMAGNDTPVPGPALQSKHDAARDIMRLTHGAHIVGVNPAFDAETFAALLRSEGYIPTWDYHLEDLVAETVGYLRHRQSVREQSPIVHVETRALLELPWKSNELAAAIGVEPPAGDDRHTALGDALWTERWWQALTAAGATS